MQVSITLRDLLAGFKAHTESTQTQEFLCHYIRMDLKNAAGDQPFEFNIRECGEAIRELFAKYFVLPVYYMHLSTVYGWFVEKAEDDAGRYEFVNLTAGGILRLPNNSAQQRIVMMEYILTQNPDATLTF